MKKYAVLVAGGRGLRMGKQLPKQFLILAGKPVLQYSVNAFIEVFPDIYLIIVLPNEYINYAKEVLQPFKDRVRVSFVCGGETRFDSVKNGLNNIAGSGIVFVHDGARPIISKELILKCYEQALLLGSAIPSVAVTDSIRLVAGENSKPISRDNLRIIQTPQTFKTDLIIDAFKCNYQPEFTDEATVVEHYGTKVYLIDGDKKNIKITTSDDLIIAEAFIMQQSLH